MEKLNAEQIISYLANAKKATPVKVYVKGKDITSIPFGENSKVFGEKDAAVVFGEWQDIKKALEENKETIEDYVVEHDRRNSAVPTLELLDIHARIEPGAIIRDQVTIGQNVVIMMGSVINIGAEIGDRTMIDMNAVLGGRATVGKDCHIGAGAVLAGVIEPPSADPVVVEDNVLIGANAVVLEGCRIGEGAVVAAGAIVTKDVPPYTVVVGAPARVIKEIDEKTKSKSEIMQDLRQI
ncbi:2,3,4,5-tetrahydropyridine-2,6-dicarboxylate N-acetyltransferase [Rummeliibacillus sp. G93]|uniref:2,3,4,5-tetrahydropyridine-2,6-dicarboxylate N-acetyltransferase n=1 Tax=Rummeliibacillus TaxID=648802 RepID=UPI0011718D0D|nr:MULTISPECIES: 2,3,4,5-tetrahydropyridine-2,6-dicarboxylate N-acetyltransferase [Rummeliibacillus]MBB5170047.1 tetrahydrodipicolinate N-acetyltransferase [Rummeliibacillus stabekisii]UQW98223.1 2,3,4,5-tetrahydropyridine-2,6-dicarboxylate N-acetyltransferase [Rummeliibacillus sp. G93]GEL04306.1 2,3,4,5-tetrahydropyridine-2,6-dicarboxylate N-acetyltransferase [Rummeliibacillus stabekisii]